MRIYATSASISVFVKVFPSVAIAETRQGLHAQAEESPNNEKEESMHTATVMPEVGHV